MVDISLQSFHNCWPTVRGATASWLNRFWHEIVCLWHQSFVVNTLPQLPHANLGRYLLKCVWKCRTSLDFLTNFLEQIGQTVKFLRCISTSKRSYSAMKKGKTKLLTWPILACLLLRSVDQATTTRYKIHRKSEVKRCRTDQKSLCMRQQALSLVATKLTSKTICFENTKKGKTSVRFPTYPC